MKTFLLGSIVSVAASVTGLSCEPSTIGGHEVPSGLTCQEDEVIGFDEDTWAEGPDGRMSHQLGCIHIDSIRYPAVFPERTSPDVGD